MKTSCVRLMALITALGMLAIACGSDAGEGDAAGADAGTEESVIEDGETAADGATAEDTASVRGSTTTEDSIAIEPAVGTNDTESEGGDVAVGDGGCADQSVLCVGVVADGSRINDQSLNQAASEGVQALQATHAATVDVIDVQDPADYATAVESLLDQDYDVIVTVGAGLSEATRTAAAANPATFFIGVDQFQADELANVVGLVFEDDKVGFLAGALAGLLTETGTVAQVLGTDLVEPVVALKEGFEAGVAYTNSGADVISTYHPGGVDLAFADPEWGAIVAREALGNGADVIFGAGGSTGDGAIAEAATEGGLALCIGVDTDRWTTFPEARPCLVSSAVKLVKPGLAAIITAWQQGAAPGGTVVGEVGLSDYHNFASIVDPDIRAQIADLTAQVTAGEVPTGYGS